LVNKKKYKSFFEVFEKNLQEILPPGVLLGSVQTWMFQVCYPVADFLKGLGDLIRPALGSSICLCSVSRQS